MVRSHFMGAVGCVSVLLAATQAQATYSIVATDQGTQAVGGAVTSCVGSQGVLVVYGPAPEHGGINAQAAANATGRDRGVQLLNMGTDPAAIIQEITKSSFDSQFNQRQYGIADLQGRAAGFTGTGTSVEQYREDRQGTLGTYTYSVQGNVLTGVAVINQAESAFRGGGCDLAEKLMLALEGGAQNGQGDSRCTSLNPSVPANAAMIEVDLPGQAAGSYLRLSNAKNGSVNAVTALRTQFNTWRQTHPCLQQDGGTPDGGTSDAGSKDAPMSDAITDAGDVSVDGDARDGAADVCCGTGGAAGAAGASGNGGTAGSSGSGGAAGTGGITGGAGGTGGTAGKGGTAGTSGSGGSAGSGAGGTSGTGGAGASGGTSGSGGASGSMGGAGTTGGRGGSATTGGGAGTGGSTSDDGGCSCRTVGRGADGRASWMLYGVAAVIAAARSRRAARRRVMRPFNTGTPR